MIAVALHQFLKWDIFDVSKKKAYLEINKNDFVKCQTFPLIYSSLQQRAFFVGEASEYNQMSNMYKWRGKKRTEKPSEHTKPNRRFDGIII